MTSLESHQPPAYSSLPSRKSSSASNTTTSSSLASPPSPAEHERSPPRAWELKVALDELELTPHRARLGHTSVDADTDDSVEYFPSWKAEDTFELSIPPPLDPSSRQSSAGATPLDPGQQPLRQRSLSVRSSASQRVSPLSGSNSLPPPALSTSTSNSSSTSSSPPPGSETAGGLAESERLPHLHLLPRPSLTPAQRKYSSSLKSATRHLLSLSLNAGSPSSEVAPGGDDGAAMMQSPEGIDSPHPGGGLPWDLPPQSFGQATDDGEFALSALTSPDHVAAARLAPAPTLTVKTSYAELRAQAEERANALLALRRDSDGSPLDEHACVVDEDDESSSDLSDSDDENDFDDDSDSDGVPPYGQATIVGGRKRSVRRRSGWRTSTRPSRVAVAPAFAEEESDGDDGASHFEFGSGRSR